MARSSKGPRHVLTARVPLGYERDYQRCARELGMELSDYIAAVLIAKHGQKPPAWLQRIDEEPAQLQLLSPGPTSDDDPDPQGEVHRLSA